MDRIPLNRMLDLAGRNTAVTGGAAGVGLAVARRLAEAGARVFILDLDGESARRAAEAFKAEGFLADSIACDVTRDDDVGKTFDIITTCGGINILVNNAGIYPRLPLSETTGDALDRVMSVNLNGALACARRAARCMIDHRRGGSIINIASIEALRPGEGFAAYAASKAALVSLTKSLALELGRHDIRVNAVAPGGILTREMLSRENLAPAKQGRAELREFMSRLPLGRMGEPDDVARAALFLASELSAYVTGSVIVVDGGYLIA